MRRKAVSILLALSLLPAGCASTTLIKSFPEGAAVCIDDSYAGVTPLEYSDFAVAGAEKKITLEKEGYKRLETVIAKDKFQVLPCIGTVFCLFPVVWVYGYPEEQTFELEKISEAPEIDGNGRD